MDPAPNPFRRRPAATAHPRAARSTAFALGVLSTAVLLAGAAGAPAGAAPPQGTAEHGPSVEDARALGTAIARVQAAGDALEQVRRERAALRTDREQRRARLERDLRTLRAELAERRRARAELEAATAEARAATRADRATLAALVADARAFADAWIGRAARAVPAVRADLPRLEAHRAGLDAADPAARAASARDLVTEAADAVARWRRRALESARVQPPGTDLELHAWVLRLGTVGEWFVGERGTHAGAAARDGERDWRALHTAGDAGPGERAAIARAAERLRGRRGPELEALPLEAPLYVVGTDEEALVPGPRDGDPPRPQASGSAAGPAAGTAADNGAEGAGARPAPLPAEPTSTVVGSGATTRVPAGAPRDGSAGAARAPAGGADGVSGADGTSGTDDPLGTSDLAPVLAELEREARALEGDLERERAALAAERASGDGELTATAEELVALELERQGLLVSAPEAERAAEEARRDAERTASELDAIRRAVADLVAALEVHARELPGGDALVARARQVSEWLDAGRPVDAHRHATALFGELDRRAGAVTFERRALRTAPGSLETVELLSIGHVAFAYRVDGRIGVALGAPREAAGFRWREDLPAAVTARWERSFDDASTHARAAGNGRTAAATPPTLRLEPALDVTGELRVGSELGAPDAVERLEQGGPVMWPLLAVALTCVVLLAERVLELYGRNRLGPDLGRRVAEALAAGEAARARALVDGAHGAVGRTVAAVLDARGRGREALENRVQEAVLLEVPRLRRSLRGIAVLAAVAPLLGLLGTITGIIETFGVLETVGQGDPALMAGGISEALLTTATGLVIAIPVLLLHGVLSGRVEAIVAAAEGQSVLVLNALALDPGEAA